MTNNTETISREFNKGLIITGMSILSLATIFGNILVIMAYQTTKALQTTTNYFIVSLAISDLCVGFISINFMTVYLVHDRWPLGNFECNLLLSIDYGVCQASGFNLVAIAFNRWMKVKYPMKKLRRSTVKRVIVILWSLSLFIWFASNFIYSAKFQDAVEEGNCHIPYLYSNKPLTVSSGVIHFFLPAFLMVTFYIMVSLRLLHQHQKLKKTKVTSSIANLPSFALTDFSKDMNTNTVEAEEESKQHSVSMEQSSFVCSMELRVQDSPKSVKSSQHNIHSSTLSVPALTRVVRRKTERRKSVLQIISLHKHRAHKRAITLLAIVIAAYIITYLPYSIFTVITAYRRKWISDPLWNFGYVFCYVNSFLNPFCYALGNVRYRKSFKAIMKNIKQKIFEKRQQQLSFNINSNNNNET